MKKIKIAHIFWDLPEGGAEKIVFVQCKEILKRSSRFEFIIIALYNDDMPMKKKFQQINIPVIHLKLRNSTSSFLNLIKTIKMLRKLKPAIINSHLSNSYRFSLLAGFFAGIPNRIATFHNAYESNSFAEMINIFLLKSFATQYIAVSKYSSQRWTENGITSKKMNVIYNSPSLILKKKYFPKEINFTDNPKICCIGNLFRNKGHDIVIKAMKKILASFTHAYLSIYGGDREDNKKNLEQLINDLSLSDSVRLCGSTDNPENVLCAADVLVHPSYAEGFGMAIVEAYAMGIPSVISQIPTHSEISKNGTCSLLFDKGNPDDCADKIIVLCSSNDIYKSISRESIEHSKKFNHKIMATEYIDLYSNILS